MTKDALISAIKNHTSEYEEEINFKPRFIELLEDSNCFLRSRLEGHLTASCWVTNQSNEKVLLLHHKKLDRWLQPGGHADGDENLIHVAEKELNEETGLENFTLSSNKIFDIDIHLIPEKKGIPEHFHFDVRFHFIAENPNEIQKNHESLDLKWVNLADISKLCNDEMSVMRMVNKSKKL